MKNLKTKRFQLNPIRIEDVKEIYELRSDQNVIKYLGREPIESIEETKKYILKTLDGISKDEYYKWAIRETEEGELLGTIGVFKIKKEKNRACVGYALRHKFHRNGIMKECLEIILNYCFEELQLHTVEAETDPLNIASQSLLKKCGFRKEAHFTEDYYFRDVYSDSAIYSLLERWRN